MSRPIYIAIGECPFALKPQVAIDHPLNYRTETAPSPSRVTILLGHPDNKPHVLTIEEAEVLHFAIGSAIDRAKHERSVLSKAEEKREPC